MGFERECLLCKVKNRFCTLSHQPKSASSGGFDIVCILFLLIDLLHNFIWLLKLPFLASLSANFSTICLQMLSKFADKFAQKSSIFPIKASYATGLIMCTLLLSGCSYRWGEGNLVQAYETIQIPYVENDTQGQFTSALIKAFSIKSRLRYCNGGADLTVRVCLQAPQEEMIRFALAPREPEEDNTKIVVSNEARIRMRAVVTLIDTQKGCRLLGPFEVEAFLDFDFEPDLSNVEAQSFALGQLEMHPLAQDTAYRPLYTLLAEKIVDYVIYSW